MSLETLHADLEVLIAVTGSLCRFQVALVSQHNDAAKDNANLRAAVGRTGPKVLELVRGYKSNLVAVRQDFMQQMTLFRV